MTTNIIYTPNLLDTISGASIVIDTCVIIHALKIANLDRFLRELLGRDCTFLSVPAVKNEFLTAGDTIQRYNELNEYLESLQLVFLPLDVEYRLNKEGCSFNIALRRSRIRNPSFVDRLVLSIPYLYRRSPEKIYIMTANHQDVPKEFFDRIGFISIDNGSDFVQIGLYEFNDNNFDKITKKK